MLLALAVCGILNIMRTLRYVRLIAASGAALLLSACESRHPAPVPGKAAIAGAAGPVTPERPSRQTCPEWHPPDDGTDYGPATAAPSIPREFRSIVSASKTVITVQGIGGKPGCVALSWIDEISGLELSRDKRFLGFETSGFEAMGYVVVDRVSGAQVEVGGRPTFSDDWTRLISAQTDITAMDGDKGIGVWEVRDDRFVALAYLPMETLPSGQTFQVDRWVGNACVEISSTSNEDEEGPESAQDAPDGRADMAAIRYFRLAPEAGKWRLKEAAKASSCTSARQSGVS